MQSRVEQVLEAGEVECRRDLRVTAIQASNTADRSNFRNTFRAHFALQRRLGEIGARSLGIETAGPNKSTLHWYSLRGHIVIFEASDDSERWEIYTSLSAEHKVSLADACSLLTNLSREEPAPKGA